MSETYIRNAVAHIQERRSAAAVSPGRVSGVGIGQDGTLINTLDRYAPSVGSCASNFTR